MKEVSNIGHFTIDLPSTDAATALSGPGNTSRPKRTKSTKKKKGFADL